MSDVYDHFPRIIAEAKPPVVVFEIGVGRAEDTGRMVDWIIGTGKPYRYFAFEPEAKNLSTITVKVGSKVTVLPYAVGDKDGTMPFISSGAWPLSGSLKQPKEHLKSYPWIPWQPPIDIMVVRLDTFVTKHELTKIDLIWLDVQGAEDLVIAGGQEALKRTRMLYTEFYNTEEYSGQIPLDEIHRRLPGRWERVEVWAGDIPGSGNVLFRDLDFQS